MVTNPDNVVTSETEGEPCLNRREASAYLKSLGFPVAVATLAKMASCGGGPRFHSFGRIPLYRSSDLREWAESRCSAPRRSTSEPRTGV
jgi:hypothetical protein